MIIKPSSHHTFERLSIAYLVLSLFYMAGIFWLSSLPGSETGPNTVLWRFASNMIHIPLFGGLGLCLIMTFRGWSWSVRTLATVGIGFSYSILDEYHQSFVPGRAMSVVDIGLDLIGLMSALGVAWAIAER